MNQSSRDHTLLDIRPSPGPGRGAVSCQSSRDKRRKRSLPGTTVRKEGRAISAATVDVGRQEFLDQLAEIATMHLDRAEELTR